MKWRKTLLFLGLYVLVITVALAFMPPVKTQATCGMSSNVEAMLSPVRRVLFGVYPESGPCGPNGVCTGSTVHYDCGGGCVQRKPGVWTPVRTTVNCPASTCRLNLSELVACGTETKTYSVKNKVLKCVKEKIVTVKKVEYKPETRVEYVTERVPHQFCWIEGDNGRRYGGHFASLGKVVCRTTYTTRTRKITKTVRVPIIKRVKEKQCVKFDWVYQYVTQEQRGKVPYAKRTCMSREANCCAIVNRRNNGGGGGGGHTTPDPQPTPTAPPAPPEIHVQPLSGDKVVFLESFAAEAHDSAKDKAKEAGLPAGTRNMPIRFSFELHNIPPADDMKATVVFQHKVNGSWQDVYMIEVYPTEYDPATEVAKYEQFSDPEKYVEYAKKIKTEKDDEGKPTAVRVIAMATLVGV